MRLTNVFAIAALLASTTYAQVTGKRSGSTCLDLRDDKVSATGILRVQAFPGPPNYESIKAGDREEDAFMLELPELDCVDEDPGAAVGESELFIDVHVSSYDDAILKKLTSLVGQKVRVTGTAFTAETAHHRAPIVLMATQAKPSPN
jgi:hypothetical protein